MAPQSGRSPGVASREQQARTRAVSLSVPALDTTRRKQPLSLAMGQSVSSYFHYMRSVRSAHVDEPNLVFEISDSENPCGHEEDGPLSFDRFFAEPQLALGVDEFLRVRVGLGLHNHIDDLLKVRLRYFDSITPVWADTGIPVALFKNGECYDLSLLTSMEISGHSRERFEGQSSPGNERVHGSVNIPVVVRTTCATIPLPYL